MAQQTLTPGAPVVMSTRPSTAPKAPPTVFLQCSEKFEHAWNSQMASSVGPINIGPDGEVDVPVDVAAKLLARRPDGEPMFTTRSKADLETIANFQLEQSGQDAANASALERRLVYIQVPSMLRERTMVRDPETNKQVPVEFDDDGMAVVTAHIYEKMRGGFGGDGTNPDKDAAKLYFKGVVGAPDGDVSASPYFEDDMPQTGPVGTARVEGQGDNLLGVEVEDLDHSRPESQETPASKLIAEFNKGPATPPASDTGTDTSETDTLQDTGDEVAPSFMDTLSGAIGSQYMQTLAKAGLDTEAEIRAADKSALEGIEGIGPKTRAKILALTHPPDTVSNSETGTTPATGGTAENAASDTTKDTTQAS